MFRLISILALCILCGSPQAAEGELVVPSRTIYPGELLSSRDLVMRLVEFRDNQAQSYVRNPIDLDGKVAKKTLLANQPISFGTIEEPRLALVGRQIRVEYRHESLVISTLGSVLQAGGSGDVISARILDGGRTVFGTLQKDGSLRVGEGDS